MRVLYLNFKNQDKETLLAVANLLRKRRVIIFPTDTVYGILADARNEKIIKKVFKIKRRSLKKPLPVFVRDIKMAKKLAKINKEQEKLLKKIWPGRITVVLERKNTLARRFFNKKTIALRIPKYKPLNFILDSLNFPLIETSVNLSDKPPLNNIKEMLKQFKDKKIQPDLIVDVGNLPKSKPSVVIDLTVSPPKILRV